jgi:hypothetical protein
MFSVLFVNPDTNQRGMEKKKGKGKETRSKKKSVKLCVTLHIPCFVPDTDGFTASYAKDRSGS